MKSRNILMKLDFISVKQRNDKITSVIYIRGTKIMRNKRLIATIVFCFYSFINVIGQDSINIWKDVDKVKKEVILETYLPKQDNNKRIAVIICPGGSYFWLSHKTEGVDVAKWLNDNGITAFVLNYRHAGFMAFVTNYRLFARGNQYPDMLQDVQRSISLIRKNADKYNVDKNKIGVMGFSAGGHLALMAGEFFNSNLIESLQKEDEKVSLRPDFLAAIYPVVTFSNENYVHKRSRRGALGEINKNKDIMRDSLSVEKHINVNMPPVFLVNCKDDPTVKYQNAELLNKALSNSNIRHKYIQYNTGGHGFGVNSKKTTDESIRWKEEFINWIESIL